MHLCCVYYNHSWLYLHKKCVISNKKSAVDLLHCNLKIKVATELCTMGMSSPQKNNLHWIY